MSNKTERRALGAGAALKATLQRELLIILRSPGDIINPMMFYVIALTLFPLGGQTDQEWLSGVAPGVIWVTALLAVMLSMESLFRSDFEDGSLEQLLLSPQPLYFHLLIKVLGHWLLTGLPLVIIAPLLGVFMALPAESLQVLIWSLLLGTPVLSLIGAIGVSLTVAVNRGGVLLSLIVLPLYIPVLIFGANAIDVASDGMSVRGQLYFLGAVLVLALSLAPLATAVALRITASR